MSISPDLGHMPYLDSTGSIQIAGQSQSPAGNVAVTSTRPYLIFAPNFVLMRPDLTGCMMVPVVRLVMDTQFCSRSDEQILSAVRFRTVSVSINRAS